MFDAKCEIHRIDYDGVLGSCPACKAEEKRHTADEAHYEERIEEQRQQRALQEQIREDRLAAEDGRRRHAEEMEALAQETLRVERARLAEELERSKAEDIRQQVRVGLLEFPVAYQERWRKVWVALERVRAEEKFQESDTAQLKEDVAVLDHRVESIREGLRQAFLPEFFERLANDGLNLTFEDNPHLQSAFEKHAAGLDRIMTALEQLAFGISRHKRVVQHPGQGAPALLRGLYMVRDSLANLKKRAVHRKLTQGCGCAAGLFSLAVILVGTLPAVLVNQGNLLFWSSICLLPGVLTFVYFLMAPIVRRRQYVKMFSLSNDLAVAVLDLMTEAGELDSLQPRSLPEKDTLKETWVDSSGWPHGIHELAESVNSNLHRASWSLEATVLEQLVIESDEPSPEKSSLEQAMTELDTKRVLLANVEKEHSEQLEDRQQIRTEYQVMFDKIREVGRQIVGGVRVPGKLMRIVECLSCGANATSEEQACPYCDSRFV